MEWSIRTQHLLKSDCLGCGSTENIQIHHVKKLKDIPRTKHVFYQIMSKLSRKQVAVCKSCHYKIHKGIYDGKSLKKAK